MSLSDWRRNNWLVDHRSSRSEISGLLSVADRDLADAAVKGLSADARFNLAYNAALQCAIAALAVAGYRVARGESHHHRAIQSLAFTLKPDGDFIAKLDKFRKKRNVSDYELAGAISNHEADEMGRVARKLRKELKAWVAREQPGLLEE